MVVTELQDFMQTLTESMIRIWPNVDVWGFSGGVRGIALSPSACFGEISFTWPGAGV